MKVLRSIKPYWFYLICEGLKKIEVGKDYPKNKEWKEEWNKGVELYCSKDMKSFNRIPKEHREKYRKYLGKVGARFKCNSVDKYLYDYCDGVDIDDDTLIETCLDWEEINIYAKGKTLYGWHISDLKIYHEPRELSEFRLCHKCEYGPIERCRRHEYSCDGRYKLTRPPQSWFYVEE